MGMASDRVLGIDSDPVLGIEVAALIPSTTGQGYLVVGRDGRVIAYGDAVSQGSLASTDLATPVVAALGDHRIGFFEQGETYRY
jgi:hypothetical protein